MTAPVKSMGRNKRAKLATAATVVAGASALLLATEIPSGISLFGGGSAALAELIARSPGVRMGGLALKAKAPRAMVSPDSATAAISGVPAEEGLAPRNAVASVLGSSAGPEGPVDNAIPGNDSPFPSDFVAPSVPTVDAPAGVTGSTPGGPGSTPFPFPGGIGGGGGGGGGPLIITPGGPGGTIPGGPTDNTPGTPTEEPPVVVPPTPPSVGGVPEPQAWALLIIGFGAIGFSMRQRRRAAYV